MGGLVTDVADVRPSDATKISVGELSGVIGFLSPYVVDYRSEIIGAPGSVEVEVALNLAAAATATCRLDGVEIASASMAAGTHEWSAASLSDLDAGRHNLSCSITSDGVDDGASVRTHVFVRPSCIFHQDCDDGDPCTLEDCWEDNFCRYAVAGNCCTVADDCPSDYTCLDLTPSYGHKVCSPCQAASAGVDCGDGLSCTSDECVLSGNLGDGTTGPFATCHQDTAGCSVAAGQAPLGGCVDLSAHATVGDLGYENEPQPGEVSGLAWTLSPGAESGSKVLRFVGGAGSPPGAWHCLSMPELLPSGSGEAVMQLVVREELVAGLPPDLVDVGVYLYDDTDGDGVIEPGDMELGFAFPSAGSPPLTLANNSAFGLLTATVDLGDPPELVACAQAPSQIALEIVSACVARGPAPSVACDAPFQVKAGYDDTRDGHFVSPKHPGPDVVIIHSWRRGRALRVADVYGPDFLSFRDPELHGLTERWVIRPDLKEAVPSDAQEPHPFKLFVGDGILLGQCASTLDLSYPSHDLLIWTPDPVPSGDSEIFVDAAKILGLTAWKTDHISHLADPSAFGYVIVDFGHAPAVLPSRVAAPTDVEAQRLIDYTDAGGHLVIAGGEFWSAAAAAPAGPLRTLAQRFDVDLDAVEDGLACVAPQSCYAWYVPENPRWWSATGTQIHAGLSAQATGTTWMYGGEAGSIDSIDVIPASSSQPLFTRETLHIPLPDHVSPAEASGVAVPVQVAHEPSSGGRRVAMSAGWRHLQSQGGGPEPIVHALNILEFLDHGFGACHGPWQCPPGGDACEAPSCSVGVCTYQAISCDDGNVCTVDACDPVTGCTHEPVADGTTCVAAVSGCVTAMTCQTGVCSSVAGAECDDGNPCTDDHCAEPGGCVHTANTAACDDENPCTGSSAAPGADSCFAGACGGSQSTPPSDAPSWCEPKLLDHTSWADANQDVAWDWGASWAPTPYSEAEYVALVDELGVSYYGVFGTDLKVSFSTRFGGIGVLQNFPAGMGANSIVPERACVLSGRVLDPQGTPVAQARVGVQGNPAFGYTATRSSGRWDLYGEVAPKLALTFEKPGYFPATRVVTPALHDVAVVDDVVLVAIPEAVTSVVLNGTSDVTLASSATATDSAGSRSIHVMLPSALTADAIFADGTSTALSTASVGMVEYTVGSAGPSALPAPLPPASAYTFCAELFVTEAIAAGANSVRFSAPIPVYVDDFIDNEIGGQTVPAFEIGDRIPVGYYDRARAVWKTHGSAVVVEALSPLLGSGQARLVLAGSTAATPAQLARANIEPWELEALAELLTAKNETSARFWRMATSHFTPFDINAAFEPPPWDIPNGGPEPDSGGSGGDGSKPNPDDPDKPPSECDGGDCDPPDCEPPNSCPDSDDEPPSEPPNPDPDCPLSAPGRCTDDPESKRCGSVLGLQSGSLGEVASLIGTAFDLVYQSDNSRSARLRANDVVATVLNPSAYPGGGIPLSYLDGLIEAELTLTVAGSTTSKSLDVASLKSDVLAGESVVRRSIVWDGKDGFGREVYGYTSGQVTVRRRVKTAYAVPTPTVQSTVENESGQTPEQVASSHCTSTSNGPNPLPGAWERSWTASIATSAGTWQTDHNVEVSCWCRWVNSSETVSWCRAPSEDHDDDLDVPGAYDTLAQADFAAEFDGGAIWAAAAGASGAGQTSRSVASWVPDSERAIADFESHYDVTLGTWPPSPLDGGWSIDAQHRYDPDHNVLQRGDGTTRQISGAAARLTPLAGFPFMGSGPAGAPTPTGGPKVADEISLSQMPDGLAQRADGSHDFNYFGDVYRVHDGLVHHENNLVGADVERLSRGPLGQLYATAEGAAAIGHGVVEAQTGSFDYLAGGVGATRSGWFAPASKLDFPFAPGDVEVMPDGALVVAERYRLRRIEPGGTATLLGGTGAPSPNWNQSFWRVNDTGPLQGVATEFIEDVVVASDGTLYLSVNPSENDGGAPAGIILRVLADGQAEKLVLWRDGQVEVREHDHVIPRLAVDRLDRLYFATERDDEATGLATRAIWRWNPYSAPTRVLGRSAQDPTLPSTLSNPQLGLPEDKSSFIFSSANPRTVFGPMMFDNGNRLVTFARGHHNNVNLLRVDPPVVTEGNSLAVLSEDGAVYYEFDAAHGYRHVHTTSAETGRTLLTFHYTDVSGSDVPMPWALSSIVDGDGLVTSLQRDQHGYLEAVIGPFGQKTEVAVVDGVLRAIQRPDGATYLYDYDGTAGKEDLLVAVTTPTAAGAAFTYDEDGLLTTDVPNGGPSQEITRYSSVLRDDGTLGAGITVDRKLGGLRTERHSREHQDDMIITRDRKPWGATVVSTQWPGARKTETSLPDGTVTTVVRGADPRWGDAVLVTQRSSISVPTDGDPDTTNPPSSPKSFEHVIDRDTIIDLQDVYCGREVTVTTSTDSFDDPPLTLTRRSKTRVLHETCGVSTTDLLVTTVVEGSTLTPWTTTLDGLGRTIASSGPSTLPVVEYEYGAVGGAQGALVESRVLAAASAVSPDGEPALLNTVDASAPRIVRYGYDDAGSSAGWLTATWLPDGSTTTMIRDLVGRVVERRRGPFAEPWRSVGFDFDGDGKLLSIQTPDAGGGAGGPEFQYGYDQGGYLATVTPPALADQLSTTITMNRAADAALEEVVYPSGITSRIVRRADGLLDKLTMPATATTTADELSFHFGYESSVNPAPSAPFRANRVERRTAGATTSVIRQRLEDPTVMEFIRDGAHLPWSVTITTRYAYDDWLQTTLVGTKDAASNDWTLELSRAEPHGWVTSTTTRVGSSAALQVGFERDDATGLPTRTVYLEDSQTGTGIERRRWYNEFGGVAREAWYAIDGQSDALLFRNTFYRDERGRVTQLETRRDNGSGFDDCAMQFWYAEDRLADVAESGACAVRAFPELLMGVLGSLGTAVAVDLHGNVTAKSFGIGSGAHSAANGYSRVDNVQQDAQSRATSFRRSAAVGVLSVFSQEVAVAYDALGRLRQKGAVEYTYDTTGQLLEVQLSPADPPAFASATISYDIDAAGHRSARYVDGVFDRGWLYEGSIQPSLEVNGSGVITKRFGRHALSHSPDTMVYRDPATGAVQRFVFIHDHVGSIIEVFELTESGPVSVERSVYGIFGALLHRWQSAGFAAIGGQPFGFAGGLHDVDTGLVRFGARDYDPELGQWTAGDPIGFAGGDTNQYAYVGADPVNGVDPRGLVWDTVFDAVALGHSFGTWAGHVWSGNEQARDAAAQDVVLDAVAAMVPFVPAGSSRLRHLLGFSDEAADAAKAGDRAADSAKLCAPGGGGADDVLYHYTDAKGAKGIAESGVIRPDSKGRVFLTTDKVSPADANNALFMGRGGTKGTHVVKVKPKGDLPLEGGTQPNELIHRGAVRDPRHSTIEVQENPF